MAIYTVINNRRFIGLEADKPAGGDLKPGETFYAEDSDITYLADENGNLLPIGRPFRTYSGLISQSALADPTIKVLENNLGTVTLSRVSVGVYNLTTTGLYTADKTAVIIYREGISASVVDTNTITISTLNSVPAAADDILNNTFVEIRVYI